MAQKPLSSVPRPVLALLAAALAAQLAWSGAARPLAPPGSSAATGMPPPPPLDALRVASLGEPLAASRLVMLHAQSLDERPGAQASWRGMDYAALRSWLARALDLDPRSQYPLLAASHVYSAVNDQARTRVMLDFVHQRFKEDPDRRWPWLAHAAIAARHQLRDPRLAHQYAQALRLHATGPTVPAWARELDTVLQRDTSGLDALRAVAGGLLAGGHTTDPHELELLSRRLEQADAAAAGKPGF
ncbi:hypothetical protein [Pseudoduganella namucuonensis]|uniref:Uncharacterized protein n=1 Tax=Pseudoduganella namucuonensis TaxID=1035707 RepID=A0A1I7L608_9BURK|nr:hypothetical protein [Pseudoduganella namucuonensis]SFV05179.1 hypothetical protein SAMN05216552_1023111 [Pseudoduganella namucuonensis]